MREYSLLPQLEEEKTKRESTPENIKNLRKEYYEWFPQQSPTKGIEKPNAPGKLWYRVSKRPYEHAMGRMSPPYDEFEWIKCLSKISVETLQRKLTILRLNFNDPTIKPIERIKIKTILNFISYKFPQLAIRTSYQPQTQSTREEKDNIIREFHGSIMAQYFGENMSISRARGLGIWTNMEQEFTKFIKRCDTCQRPKLTRVKRKCEAIIPETPVEPNQKIAMEIF